MQTLSELLESSVRRFPDKAAIIFEDKPISYREFDEWTARLANVLRANGVQKGDPVGLYLPNRPELAAGYYACQKLGAIAVPMSSMFRAKEVGNVVSRTRMPVLICDAVNFHIADQIRQQTPTLKEILVTSAEPPAGGAPLPQMLAAADPHLELVECEPDDVAVVFFTSGTTGVPKGAMMTHKCIYHTVRDMATAHNFRYGQEVVLGVLPNFNNFGATVCMNGSIYNGGTLCIIERWDTDRVLDVMSRYGVTYMPGTPTMHLYVMQKYDPQKHDLSRLKLGATGGAPVAPEMIEKFEQQFGVRLLQGYGATESSGIVVFEPTVGIRKRGSAGVQVGSTGIKIVDDDLRELPRGEVGEIWIEGDTLIKGYWDDPETTAKTFRNGGWLSGDLGYMDEDGYLFIKDRKKDLIITGGANIYPIEVEGLLYTRSDVALAAVLGIPDELKGEIPVAYIVPAQGSNPTEAEIIAFCRENLSAYKVPRQVKFISEADMPLGPSGKVLKRLLRERVLAELKAGGGN